MASTIKTSMGLTQYAESDIPDMYDVNSDNKIIDDAISKNHKIDIEIGEVSNAGCVDGALDSMYMPHYYIRIGNIITLKFTINFCVRTTPNTINYCAPFSIPSSILPTTTSDLMGSAVDKDGIPRYVYIKKTTEVGGNMAFGIDDGYGDGRGWGTNNTAQIAMCEFVYTIGEQI